MASCYRYSGQQLHFQFLIYQRLDYNPIQAHAMISEEDVSDYKM